MEKVILWGRGNAFHCYRDWLRELEEKQEIEILAVVDKEATESKVEDWSVIPKEKIAELHYDRILITVVEGNAIRSIKSDAKGLGVNAECMISIEEFECEYGEKHPEYYNKIIDTQLEVLQEILSASEEEVTDYAWMLQRLERYGMFPFKEEASVNPLITRWGILQVADEFTKYCNYLSSLRVDSAIEIGVYRGRSSYFMCALLSRSNPSLKYVMVDICDMLDSFDRFQEILPALDKQIPTTSENFLGESFDFVFIDGDHSYDGAMQDYLNLGRYAGKLVCFHDIYAHEYDKYNGGVSRAWQEASKLNEDKEQIIFSTYPDEWIGIGCIVM